MKNFGFTFFVDKEEKKVVKLNPRGSSKCVYLKSVDRIEIV